MALRPGEENVATLFGDVHYFYGPPTDKPPHHRFDKGSYIYLFENANERRARIEIANQPGTDDQDAFDGYLDTTHLSYSYKRTCVVTLTVGEITGHDEWHLPTYDPHNQNKYHYPLKSLDIYFWTQPDALQFVNGIRRVLPPSQCEVLDEPGPPPPRQQFAPPPTSGEDHNVSSVVQKLEKVAIADTTATTNTSPAPSSLSAPSFVGAPVSATGTASPPPGQPPAPAFVPMAYNPAAPAAPEQIATREKTPPPEDGGLNPLHQTLATDAGTPFSPGLMNPMSPGMPPPQYQGMPGQPAFPGPPMHSVASPGLPPQGFGAHGHPGLARSATMPASPFGVAGFSQVPGTPGLPMASPGLPPQYAQQQQQFQAMRQVPGTPGTPQQVGNEYSIHQQFYVPEGGPQADYKPKKEVKGNLEKRAGQLERGVSGFLKKLEKRVG